MIGYYHLAAPNRSTFDPGVSPPSPQTSLMIRAQKLQFQPNQSIQTAPAPCPTGQYRDAQGNCRIDDRQAGLSPGTAPGPSAPEQPIDPYTNYPVVPTPFWKKWPFWAAVGGSVIVIGGATFFALRR